MARKPIRRTCKKRRVRRRKTNFFKSFYFYFTSFVFIASSVFYLIYLSPYFEIDQVQIIGADQELESQIQESVNQNISFNLFAGLESLSIFTPFKDKIASLMGQFPQIEDLEIQRDFPNKIILKVKEKTPFALWCVEGECDVLDENASFISDASEDEEGLLIIEEEEALKLLMLTDEFDKAEILEYCSMIKENMDFACVEKFVILSDKLAVVSSDFCDVYFDPKDDMEWQIEKLLIFAEEEADDLTSLEYIDVRFSNQTIVK